MAKTTKSRKKTSRKKSTVKKNRKMAWWKKTLLLGIVAFGFVFFTYLGYLDYSVRRQFAGKRWALPAYVYASPVEFYPGYQLSRQQFGNLLSRLNYRRDYHLSSPASYYRKGESFYLKTRHFQFWDGLQQSRKIKVSFSGGQIGDIIDLETTGSLALVRMDPVQIGSFYPTRKEDRILIKLEQAPDYLIQGLLSTEDRDFYQHYGVSFKGIARAMWANIKAGAFVQGGSTITQQLVKNFYLTPERSLWRKINEALMALILEYRFDKDEILEAYLNEIYLGQDGASSIHGFGLASEFYFSRPLDNLSLDQIATLVALVRGPSYYDPRRYPERAIKRRNLVLTEMHRQGYITKKQMLAAKKKKLDVIARSHRSSNRYPAFMELVKRQLRQEYKESDLTSEGLRIFTTLDVLVQDTLQQAVADKLTQLEKRPRTRKLESAAIVTRRENGEIVALVGSRHANAAGFNRALDALRPIGSLMKPAIYLTALEYPDRYTAITRVSDTAITVKGPKGKNWTPKNYDNTEHGEVPLHTALSHSYNLATVHVGMDVGIARVAKTLRHLGVKRNVKLYPSLLLGATPLTPLEVTQMYQTFAGDGFVTPLRSIRAVIAQDGERLQSYPFTVRQAVDPAAMYITNTLLQEVVSEGTARSAYLYLPEELGLAGKTGTTNKLRDSWFAGFSGDYLSVVWVGRDDNKPSGLTGASGALQIWIRLMRNISHQPVNLIPPDNITWQWIDEESGLLANEQCPGARQFPFVKGSEPSEYADCVESDLERAKEWFNDFLQDTFQ